jgi:hypothetical protein
MDSQPDDGYNTHHHFREVTSPTLQEGEATPIMRPNMQGFVRFNVKAVCSL